MEAVWLGSAFIFGLFAHRLGMPTLIGYLCAGFFIAAATPLLPIADPQTDTLSHIAHAGVLLLLFSVGLKLDVKQIVKPEIAGTGIAHMLFSVIIYAPIIHFVFGKNWETALLLSSALAFSSTVLAALVLESKQELRAFHGRIAIGILIVQDLIAMGLMSATAGELPSIWSLGLLLLPLLRPALFKIMDWCEHDERLILFGLLLALVAGGMGFHALGLSGELGALVMGALCAKHDKASDLSKTLWSFKEVFLVGFFLTIGLNGMPTQTDIIFALTMVALLPVQAIIFFIVLTRFKLKSRSAFLSSITLTNFSEFGLIVAAMAMPEYLVPLALCVAFSFVVSAPLNRYAHPLFDRIEHLLTRFEKPGHHPDEAPVSTGNADTLVMGMGKMGRSAYREIEAHGGSVIGFDSDDEKARRLSNSGMSVVYADAEHANFWKSLSIGELKHVILAMDCPDAALIATRGLREAGFNGVITAHAEHAKHAEKLLKAGADDSHVTVEDAGRGLAASAIDDITKL